METFEYELIQSHEANSGDNVEADFLNQLNVGGKDGWRVVTGTLNGDNYTALMERSSNHPNFGKKFPSQPML